MPSRWAQLVIVLFWLTMTGWLLKRDVLPRLGFGELNYRGLLTDRAVEEPTHWVIELDEERVGAVLTIVRPVGDGSYLLISRSNISGKVVPWSQAFADSQLSVDSDFNISPLGKLEKFKMEVAVDGTELKFHVDGIVDGNFLRVHTTAPGGFDKEIQIPIDPELVMVDLFSPLDRIPDLRVGKTWTTRMIDPVKTLSSSLLGGGEPSITVVRHTVVGNRELEWGGQPWVCYLIESQHDNVASKTWVRVRDSKTLRQEVSDFGRKVAFELDPMLERPKNLSQ